MKMVLLISRISHFSLAQNEFICLQIKVFMLTILVMYLVYIRWEVSSIDRGKGVLIAAV